MEGLEHSLYLVTLTNRVVGPVIASFLALFGRKIDPQTAIPDYVLMSFLVFLILVVFFGLLARRLEIIPRGKQNLLEAIIEFFEGLLVDIIGPEGKKYLPLVGTVGLFILTSNLLGLIPGLMSPTSQLNVTVACALTVFIYYHWQGMRSQGVIRYLKHFTGPIPLLAPLLLPIEIISHFSRPVSLSIRLFGNIFAEELLIVVIASIIPFVLPLPFMAISIFTATIQAFVFVLLTCIYLAGAVTHEEEAHGKE